MLNKESDANGNFGLFKFFYKTTLNAIDVYGGRNPLKAYGIMSSSIIGGYHESDLLDTVLHWSFDRHFKEQRVGDPSVLPALSDYSRDVREVAETASYDDLMNDFSDDGRSMFKFILGREPTEIEIEKIKSRANKYFVGNFESDGYTLSQSYSLKARLIALSKTGRATSQWGLKFAQWLGFRSGGIDGRERFGLAYKRFAAMIELECQR